MYLHKYLCTEQYRRPSIYIRTIYYAEYIYIYIFYLGTTNLYIYVRHSTLCEYKNTKRNCYNYCCFSTLLILLLSLLVILRKTPHLTAGATRGPPLHHQVLTSVSRTRRLHSCVYIYIYSPFQNMGFKCQLQVCILCLGK